MKTTHRLAGPVEKRRAISKAEVVRPARALDPRYLSTDVDRNEIARQVGRLWQQCVDMGIDTIEGCRVKPHIADQG